MTADAMSTKKGTIYPAPGKVWLAALLAAIGTLVLAWLLSPGLGSNLGQTAVFLSGMDAAGVREWLLSFGALSPLVYFLVMVGQVVLSPIPASPVTLAGALVFGVAPGLALSMTGSVVGSAVVFLAVRRWGESLVIRLAGKETFRKYAGKLDASGWWFFSIMLLPLMPDDAVCALAGLSTMSFKRYVAFMVVGRLPGATLTALLASDTITGSTAAWISVGVFVAALLVLGFIYRGRLESWLLRRSGG